MSMLDSAVSRQPVGEHDGRSGASLERVELADGRRLVVKRTRWATDLVRRLSDDREGREAQLWRAGVLDRAGVGHAIVDAWTEGDETVVVMRDLGAAVFGWHHVLTRTEVSRLLAAVTAMHAAGPHSDLLLPVNVRARVMLPAQMQPMSADFDLVRVLVDGWRHFDAMVDPGLASDIAALRADPSTLVVALAQRPAALIHGDLWPVNTALSMDGPVLLDWGLASWAPPALDLVSLLAGAGAAHIAMSREEVIDEFRTLAGRRHDEVALRLALLLGLLEFGWNKALDAATAPTATERARHRDDLEWWVAAAISALRSDLR
jgi:hypothetical protein